MSFFCIKRLMFTKNDNKEEKVSLYSHCNESSFKKFATIDKKENERLTFCSCGSKQFKSKKEQLELCVRIKNNFQ